MLITGDGYWSTNGVAGNAPMALTYFPNNRFDNMASGFKEYTIVGVKVTFLPVRIVTAGVNTV